MTNGNDPSPYCGEKQTGLCEYWPEDYGADSWDVETECGSCDKPYVVRCTVSVDYRIVKPIKGPVDE